MCYYLALFLFLLLPAFGMLRGGKKNQNSPHFHIEIYSFSARLSQHRYSSLNNVRPSNEIQLWLVPGLGDDGVYRRRSWRVEWEMSDMILVRELRLRTRFLVLVHVTDTLSDSDDCYLLKFAYRIVVFGRLRSFVSLVFLPSSSRMPRSSRGIFHRAFSISHHE